MFKNSFRVEKSTSATLVLTNKMHMSWGWCHRPASPPNDPTKVSTTTQPTRWWMTRPDGLKTARHFIESFLVFKAPCLLCSCVTAPPIGHVRHMVLRCFQCCQDTNISWRKQEIWPIHHSDWWMGLKVNIHQTNGMRTNAFKYFISAVLSTNIFKYLIRAVLSTNVFKYLICAVLNTNVLKCLISAVLMYSSIW